MSNPIKKCLRCGVYQTARFCECESNSTLPDLEEWNHIVANFPALPSEETEVTGGTKYDDGKPDLSLLPPAGLEGAARVFAFGAAKYGRYNFTKGFEQTRLLAAAMRHITAYTWGQDNDAESGLDHIHHALCCLLMLEQIKALGTDIDNRYKPLDKPQKE